MESLSSSFSGIIHHRISTMTASIPRVRHVMPIEGHVLLVTFDNAVMKRYDVQRLTDREMFAPLKNPHFFDTVAVEPGGYAVSWGPDIDISEYELWQHGITETGGAGHDVPGGETAKG
ncbi:DUF2442 domain-containing protein [Thiohalocapsa halophila]